MEFSIAEIIAIGALHPKCHRLFLPRSHPKGFERLRIELRGEIGECNQIRDTRNEMRNEITDLRNEMNIRFTKLDESFTNHLMFMHGDINRPLEKARLTFVGARRPRLLVRNLVDLPFNCHHNLS